MRALLVALALAWLAACTPTDVGQCCQAAAGSDPSVIPEPAFSNDGTPANAISTDPQLLCENIACVSYQGSNPYCTQSCEYDDACPSGFVCAPVINSDPGDGADIGAAKFCVKVDHACE